MSFLKIIFIVFALISAGTSVGVGYFWQHMAFSAPLAPIQTASTTTAVLHTVADVLSKSATTSPSFHLTKPITVSTDQLPPLQKKVLDTLGVGIKTFTITPGMVSCAVDAFGTARVEEIKNGSAPSLNEGLTLLACAKK